MSEKQEVTVEELSGLWIEKMDFSDYNELEVYISCSFEQNGEVVSENTSLFTAPKHFRARILNSRFVGKGIL